MSTRQVRMSIGNATTTHCRQCSHIARPGCGGAECWLFKMYNGGCTTLEKDGNSRPLRSAACKKAEAAYKKAVK